MEVPVNNWEFGNAFKMTNQTLGIINENNVQALQIKSTLTFFGDDADAKRKFPPLRHWAHGNRAIQASLCRRFAEYLAQNR